MPVNLNGIDLSGASMAPSRKTTATHGPAASQSDASSQDGQGGEVSITSTAALMANIEQSLGAKPAFDESRVAALRQAIADGSYQVQPGRIAGALLHTEQALSPLPLAEI